MAHGFKHGGVGGSTGGSLGFEIVGGTTRPAKPTQNMIWVNTDTEITGYAFSATEPETPVEGMLLVTIADSGNIKSTFTADKEWVTVYPISAKQYVSGAWVDKTVKSYQNGEWVDWWNGELYTPGNEYESITGGWVVRTGTYRHTGTTLKVYASSSESITTSIASTANTIDLTNYSTLSVTGGGVSLSGTGTALIKIYAASTTSWGASTSSVALVNIKTNQTVTLDVSGLTGSFYVALFADAGTGSSEANVSSLKLS